MQCLLKERDGASMLARTSSQPDYRQRNWYSPDGLTFYVLNGMSESSGSTPEWEQRTVRPRNDAGVLVGPGARETVHLKMTISRTGEIATTAALEVGLYALRTYVNAPIPPNFLTTRTFKVPRGPVTHYIWRVEEDGSDAREIVTGPTRNVTVFLDGGIIVASALNERVVLPSMINDNPGQYMRDGRKCVLNRKPFEEHARFVPFLPQDRYPLLYERCTSIPETIVPFK